ncbi:MAG: flagellar biosynthetic protein FliO [Lachnospira sp.]
MIFATMSSRLESFVQFITLLLIFIFVLAVTYFSTRIVGKVQKNKLSGSNIQILETMRISNNKYIQIVRIGSKCFSIAVGKDEITYLCEINEDDLIYKEQDFSVNSESFKAILDKFKKDKPEE